MTSPLTGRQGPRRQRRYGGGGGGGAGLGGAIFNAGTLMLIQSTLSGNIAVGGDGTAAPA